MHQFQYVNGRLCCEQVPLARLAKEFGTPLYVYSQGTFTDHFRKLDQAMAPLDHLVCFAVKSNANLAVLRALANEGAGFDIVSEGELRRVIAAGGDPAKCAFAGVGKSEAELAFALTKNIYTLNVESEAEVDRINRVAKGMNRVAPIAVRVNPNVDAGTHAKITTGTYENKFGIAFERVGKLYARASKLKNLRLRGIQMHIGSQLTDVKPFEAAVRKVVPLVAKLAGKYNFEFFSIGGGIGIVYRDALASGSSGWWTTPEGKKVLTPAKYAATLTPLLQQLGLKVLLEPGRFISGNAGALVTKIEYVKETGRKRFVIVDAAMNDLIRPALYDSFHEIVPLTRKRAGRPVSTDVVGPVCESGDFFCKDRPLPKVAAGEHLALLSAGAYGSVMSSNYNARPLPAEVLVNGRKFALVRKRQEVEDIWRNESIPAWLDQNENSIMKNSLKQLVPLLLLMQAPVAIRAAEEFVIGEAAEFRSIVPDGAKVEKLAGDLKFVEGPVWVPKNGGYLLFSDIPANQIRKWTAKDGLSVFREPSQNANGNTLDNKGHLLTCEHTGRRVAWVDKEGLVQTVVSHFEGRRLNSPNDVVVKSDRTIWFTDPDYGIQPAQKEMPGNYVFRFEPKNDSITSVVKDFDKPNGLCFSPDEKVLYVADSGKPHHIRAFDVKKDGSLANGRVFCVIDKGGPDGIRCDAKGRVFSSAGDGVHIFSPGGKLIGKILTPESPANLCFGGKDGRTLFITARKSLFSIHLSVKSNK